MGYQKEFDTDRVVSLIKLLNAPDWIDVILLEYKVLHNIKYLLNTMIICDPISIRKSEDNICVTRTHIPKAKDQKEKKQKANNGPH